MSALKKYGGFFLKFVLPFGIGIYLLWHFYTAMDQPTKDVFFKAFREADYFWIFLSLILGWLSHISRAIRWGILLEPIGVQTKLSHRYHAMMVGYLINLLIPRAGEATRAALLYQTDKVPFAKSFGTIIGERVIDLLMLGLVVLVTLFLSFEDLMTIKDIITSPSGETVEKVSIGIWIVGFLVVLTVIGVVVIVKSESLRKKISSFIREIIAGVFSIFKSKRPFAFIALTVAMWVLYIVFFGICFFAFEDTTDFPVSGIFIGFIAGTLGIMFTNGGIGAYPYLVGIVVTFYIGDQFDTKEAAEGLGKAVGMIIWSSQTLGMIILGLVSMVLIPRNYKKEKDESLTTPSA